MHGHGVFDHELLKERGPEQKVNRENGQGSHDVQSYLAKNIRLFPTEISLLSIAVLASWLLNHLQSNCSNSLGFGVVFFFSCFHYLPVLFWTYFSLQLTFHITENKL